MLHDVGIISNSTVNLVVTSLATGRSWSLEAHGSLLPSRSLQYLIDLAHGGMACGLVPMLALDGTGGVYFLRDRRKRIVAVYKPRDEEAFTQNNPRGLMSFGNDNVSLRPGIRPGESYLREMAAYLLDHDHKLGVPGTAVVESRHPSYSWSMQPSAGGGGQQRGKDNKTKVGSFHEFVLYDEIVSDIAPERLERAQVQRLAVLDIRILNCDRHDANILAKRKNTGYELIPIDHGMSFPETLEIAWCDWCWLSWPQVKEPLDPDVYTYILGLDPKKDAALLLEKLNLRPSCIRIFRAVCILLIEGAKAGLTLYEIANVILRLEDLNTPSIMEHIIFRAKDLSLATEAEIRVPWSYKDSFHYEPPPRFNAAEVESSSSKTPPLPSTKFGSINVNQHTKHNRMSSSSTTELTSSFSSTSRSNKPESKDSPKIRLEWDSSFSSLNTGGENWVVIPLSVSWLGRKWMCIISPRFERTLFLLDDSDDGEDGHDDGVSDGCSILDKESDNYVEIGFWNEPMSDVDRRNSTRVWHELEAVESEDVIESQSSSCDVGGGRGAGVLSLSHAAAAPHSSLFQKAAAEVTSSRLDPSVPDIQRLATNPKQQKPQSYEGSSSINVKIPPPIAVIEKEVSLQPSQPQDLNLEDDSSKIITSDYSDNGPPTSMSILRSNSFGGFRSFPLSPPNDTDEKDVAFESHFLYFVTHLVKEEIRTICSIHRDTYHDSHIP